MSKTGINFERCNIVSAKLHNERDAAYLESVRASGKATYELFADRTDTNLHWTSKAYVGKSLEQILEDCRERYRRAVGQEPQEQDRVRKVKDKKTGLYKEVTTAGWSPIREGVCPVKEDTRLADFNPLIKHLAAKGVRVISIDIHRDEGYQDPLTGERKYNYHAHIIADWTDRVTGKTAKLNKADMSELQTVLADALGMERGESKELTGKDHLTPAQQREKAAAKHAAQLEAENQALVAENSALRTEQATLAAERDKALQLADSALERAQAAEKAASREQFRSNAADVGARILGVFGRGAVAEANSDRDEALRRAEEAEAQAAAAQQAAETAENARILAVKTAEEAGRAKTRAEREKAEYGRQMYENGVADGVKQGRASAQASIGPLQQQLADKQTTIDQMQADHDELQEWLPTAAHWRQYRDEMRQAGLDDTAIKQVFRNGSAKFTVEHKEPGLSAKPYETNVWIGSLRTAANRREHGVWFLAPAIDQTWRRVAGYLKAVKDHIWQNLGKKKEENQGQGYNVKLH